MKLLHNSLSSKRFHFLSRLLPVLIFTGSVFGQGSPTYPYVSPTAAASGMTSGLENGSTSGTMNMMQVRASAQESERAAAAAAMARTAETAIEEQGLKTALDKARQTRQAKIEASERLKWQRVTAYNAYNKVSAGEMSTWKDQDGNVKIGRDIPADFVQSVKADEAARAAAAPPANKGFTPLKNISDKVTKAVGIDEPISDTGLSMPKPLPPAPVEAQGRSGRGFNLSPPKLNFPKLSAPKFTFPKIGGNRESEPETEPSPQYSSAPPQVGSPEVAANNAAPTASASATSVATPAASSPVTIQKSRSGAEMLRASEPPAPAIASNSQPAIEAPEKKSGGFFSRNRSSSSSRKFGFGKKEPEPEPAISNSLFPSDMTPSQPAGNYDSNPPRSSGERTIVSLPGSEPEPRKRFSLSKPKLSIPGNIGKADTGTVSPNSTINRSGNNYYVVNETAQFMKYGASRTETTISAVRPGAVVMMTKPGTDWATVQLADGSSGVIQTKNLRGADSSEVPSNFAPAQANYATEMKQQINSN